jgi:hypothetical protein
LRHPSHLVLTLIFLGFATGTLRQSLFSRCKLPQLCTILATLLSVGYILG